MNAGTLTHRSFFSGVGGADLGLARAGFVTLSTSEIEPYATVVLSEREPDADPLGCIKTVAGAPAHEHDGYECLLDDGSGVVEGVPGSGGAPGQGGVEPRGLDADLWTGGFPCQDLSVAGKRKGFAGDRSVLAFVFLDLVELYRPPAFLLENVPGLLSSNGGRDLGRLLREVVDLGYGVAYRVLDARFFGVPQRRRRVFILALRSDGTDPDGRAATERAASVLSVGAECRWHPTKGVQAKARIAARSRARAAASGRHRGADGPSPDTGGMREADGLAGRVDDRADVASSITASAGHHGHSSPRGDGTDNLVVTPELAYAIKATEHRSYDSGGKNGIGPVNLIVAPTLRVGPQRPEDGGPGDTVPIIVQGFALRGRGEGNVPEPFEGIVPALRGASGGSTQPFIVAPEVASTLNSGGNDGGFRTEPGEHLVAYVKEGRAQSSEAGETWGLSPVAPTVNIFDVGDTRATVVIGTIREHVRPGSNTDHSIVADMVSGEDPLLPDGLDSHRYRCCGNGLVAAKTEWIGSRLAAAMTA